LRLHRALVHITSYSVNIEETMIKLRDLLIELKSIQNIEKIDTSKPYTIIWNNGDLVAMSPGATPPMVMGKIFPMMIKPVDKMIKLQDYDDWSSFKDILKMQQAVKDMLRAKLVDMTWKVDIPMSNIKKNIGSVKIADFLNYNATFTDVVPKAFHGTTDKDLESILKIGIVPPSKTDREILKWTQFYGPDSEDKTYWSIDYSRAEYYAEHAVQMYKKMGIKSKPIVVEVDNLPMSMTTADDDFQSNMSMIQMLAAMQHGKLDKQSAIQSIRMTSQFAVKGRIPPSMITKVHKA
jgi:hypothetical protein